VGQGFVHVLAKQALHCWATVPVHFFCSGYFRDGVSQVICPGWPWTMILQTSASQIARITGVSHKHLAKKAVIFFKGYFFWGWDWGLKSGLHACSTTWDTLPALLLCWVFSRVSPTICLGWLPTKIFLISASEKLGLQLVVAPPAPG
jgi:hypothetical protein